MKENRSPARPAGKAASAPRTATLDDDTPARLAVNLPLSMHRQLKTRAAQQGQSIRDYIISLLRRDGIK